MYVNYESNVEQMKNLNSFLSCVLLKHDIYSTPTSGMFFTNLYSYVGMRGQLPVFFSNSPRFVLAGNSINRYTALFNIIDSYND